jgi:hypothetical protein
MIEISSLLFLITIVGYVYFDEKRIVKNKIPFDIKYKVNK